MTPQKTHIYFVPGMAAGKEIFRNIHLPEDQFETTVLEWWIPKKKETMEAYASRMASRVKSPKAVLVGVSFGGVLVQEMSAFLELKALIIISSVKSRYELPSRLKFARDTSMYRLLPTGWISRSENLTRFALGPRSRKRLRLYEEYLSVRNKGYLDWAIRNMVCWNREVADPNVIHIHGDRDWVFPLRNISSCTVVKGGNHVMIINRGSHIAKMLQNLLKNN